MLQLLLLRFVPDPKEYQIALSNFSSGQNNGKVLFPVEQTRLNAN